MRRNKTGAVGKSMHHHHHHHHYHHHGCSRLHFAQSSEVALFLRKHASALAGPPQVDIKMMSMPPTGASQGVDINYNKSSQNNGGGAGGHHHRDHHHSPYSPIGSPSCPYSSWEESMLQLSRDLQTICRSPDRYDMPVFPPSPGGNGSVLTTSGPTSPSSAETTTSSCSSSSYLSSNGASLPTPPPPLPTVQQQQPPSALKCDVGKMLSVRHVQSEEKLREKLTYICRSPRRGRSSTSSSNEGESNKLKAKAAKNTKRKAGHSLLYFKASINIGNHTIEDLSVVIEDHKLKVFSERRDERDIFSERRDESDLFAFGELPVVLDLPPDVNPQKLICIVRDGVLEVKESKRKCPPNNKVLGRQLSMSYTSTGIRADHLRPCQGHNPDQCPIVIEDDGSHLLKLVLRVPPVYKFSDLQIKTVDNQLIVTGQRGPQRSLSASFSPPSWNKENREEENRFCKVFELPSSVDPFSITARLTDQHQLVIQATLSPRTRSNTM